MKYLVPLVVPVMQDCILSQSKMSPSVVKGLLVPYVANANSLEKSFVTRIKSEALNLISGNVEKQGRNVLYFNVFQQRIILTTLFCVTLGKRLDQVVAAAMDKGHIARPLYQNK